MVKILPDNAPPLPALKSAHSILVIKLDALGDCVLLSPFLKNLRFNCPDAAITYLVPQANLSLLEHCPVINKVIPLPPDWHTEPARVQMIVQQIINNGPYDLAIVPRWEADYYGAGFLAQNSGAPVRIAYSASCLPRKMAANPDADNSYTHVIEDRENRHEIDRGLMLLEAMGGNTGHDQNLSIWLNDSDEKSIGEFLAQEKLAQKEFLVFAPGASLPLKIWPARSWFEFTQRILKETDYKIVVTGAGDVDAQYAAQLSMLGGRVISAVNRFNPRQAAALIAKGKLLAGADSFAKHAAAAFQVPVIEISCHPQDGDPDNEYHSSRFGVRQSAYAFVQPESCGPVISSDNHPHCIEKVTLDQVMRAFQAMIG